MRYRILATGTMLVILLLGTLLFACGPDSGSNDPGLVSLPTAGALTPSTQPTASPPGPQDSTPEVVPPPAILEVDGQEQTSGIGTYCWSRPTGADTAVSVCADMVGFITPGEPITVPAAFTAHFQLAPEEIPVELLLNVAAVSPEDELGPVGEDQRAWPVGLGERYELSLERAPAIELELAPGLYVLDLSARWDEWGDVSYGFLVEVQSSGGMPVAIGPDSAQRLTVDESPIVAADVDGPGHFEYEDRLGAEILARIEGLRERAIEQNLDHANKALEPFGYRLEGRYDAEWGTTFYDLFREGDADPVLAGLAHFWPVSVNTSGTDFCLTAENAPNVFPLYLKVQNGRIEAWEPDLNAYLPPVYVGDALAQITFTGFPSITYQVELDQGQPDTDGLAVYRGTADALGAYMPLRSFTAWDGHWVLEVDDHLIVDGQDLGETMGYDAAYGFALIRGQPFYFFEQGGKVRMSYAGQVLPFVYDQVFHNQCCEAAMHNVLILDDVALFHAMWNGTWYLVEAGVYDGEMAGTYRYTAPEGWSFRYPMHWDLLDPDVGFVQDTSTGKTVSFASQPTNKADLEQWLESEVARKLAATEAQNTLAESLSVEERDGLSVYRYAISSRLEATETLLRTTVFFDGQRRYEFQAAVPPMTDDEYAAILASFTSVPSP